MPRLLLVSGIPASGKSSYCRWLANEKGYRHLDVDVAADEGAAALERRFAEMLRASTDGVIDWGFPVSYLETVRKLIADGIQAWWFDGDRDAARQMFQERHKRGTHKASKAAFDFQMRDIEAHWDDIERLYRGRMIQSVLPGPRYLEREVIFERMGL